MLKLHQIVDVNLEIQSHLPQNSLRVFHIDIRQMVLTLPVLFVCVRQHPNRSSRNVPIHSRRKEDPLWYKSLNQAGQRRKSDLSWHRGKSEAVSYQKQKGLEGRSELDLNKQKFFFSNVNIVHLTGKFKSSPEFRSSITMSRQ